MIIIPDRWQSGERVYECSGVHQYALPSTYIKDSAMAGYNVGFYRIDIEMNDTSTFIRGNTAIHARAVQELHEVVFELSNDHQVDSIFIDGSRQMDFLHFDDVIRIANSTAIFRGQDFQTVVYYHGAGGQNSFFSGISNRRDFRWNKQVTYTLSESFNAHDWFVCKQVLTDKADSAYIYIVTPDHLKAASNGILAGVDSLPGGKVRHKWETRYPVAYYLLSAAVADYQDYSFYVWPEQTPDSILVQNYVFNDSAFLPFYYDEIHQTAELLGLYSGTFGTYPFWKEKYGHSFAPIGGGMEHQTMTTLQSFDFTLVAHELAHQWFGDNVTCASWQDIWINEGFASYGEYLALEFLHSKEAADVWMSGAHNWALTEPEGSVYIPEADAMDERRIFSRALSYKKGAALLHMIRGELNDDSLFFSVLRTFQEEFGDSTATGNDFLHILNETSGREFDWFFEQWYYGSGYPEFNFNWWVREDSLIIHCEQSGSSERTPLFQIKMELLIEYADGRDTLLNLLLKEAEEQFGILVSGEVAGLHADPNGWIPDKTKLIRKYISEGDFYISPNPFEELLNVTFSTDARREINLADMNGRIVQKWNFHSAEVTLNTNELNQGLYLLQVKEGNDSYTAKVMKQ
jgi:aminopeptidase N